MNFQLPTINFSPVPDPGAIVIGKNVRFTILTSRMLRLEFSKSNTFEDRPSQAFWYRKQPLPQFKLFQTDEKIEIDTGDLLLQYQITELGFSRQTLKIKIFSTEKQWSYGDRDWQNLKGTSRTLDAVNGEIELEHGLISRSGWAVVDDSASLVFDENGWLTVRSDEGNEGCLDIYFFGYGNSYVDCLQEYFTVSGKVPLVPRWVLGNWWSRYWEYTQTELTNLMLQFQNRQVPLSVCIIDMDWHITSTGNKSSGWTGYTWNKKLFPDPELFLKWLHEEMGLRTAMNLHPAEGIWPHEDAYPLMASKMGIDPQSNQPVEFDIADPEFAKNYFDILHHPYEAMGVDFWWMDWQQGARISQSRHKVGKYLDPLWWLNHLHFYDLGRNSKLRSFIFSRWGGLGNHRYPIGFSGDTVVSWESLAFQPYFTATAANVGFGWWSHDIGGHMAGIEDSELYTRWVQFGVFSPILRLHSTKNPFQDRAPWAFGEDIFRIARDALQLRHALIPYLYSMACRFSQTGIPISTPMYFAYPNEENAYHCPNQYLFGDQLLAAPFVSPHDPDTNLSRTSVWLPTGDWYNFFNGENYRGGRWVTVYGSLDDIPVFAKSGAIVPIAPRSGWGGVDIPNTLTIQIYPGASNGFILQEDDGVSADYTHGMASQIHFDMDWTESHLTLRVAPAVGSIKHLPSVRTFDFAFYALRKPDQLTIYINDQQIESDWTWNEKQQIVFVQSVHLTPSDRLVLDLFVTEGNLADQCDRRREKILQRLKAFRLGSGIKHRIALEANNLIDDPNMLGMAMQYLSDSQISALRNVFE